MNTYSSSHYNIVCDLPRRHRFVVWAQLLTAWLLHVLSLPSNQITAPCMSPDVSTWSNVQWVNDTDLSMRRNRIICLYSPENVSSHPRLANVSTEIDSNYETSTHHCEPGSVGDRGVCRYFHLLTWTIVLNLIAFHQTLWEYTWATNPGPANRRLRSGRSKLNQVKSSE